jgi:transcriptional regulator with XRE-family HTH domain
MARNKRPEAFSDVVKAIGVRIAWVREIAEPNRSAAARDLGVDPSTLSHLETGDRTPSIFNVIAISNRYRVTTDFLLKGLLKSETDYEMAAVLTAQHPELASQLIDMVRSRDKVPDAGRSDLPTTATTARQHH